MSREEERFWTKVDKRGPNECWPWLGAKLKGYGRYRYAGRSALAHRLAYAFAYGIDLSGLLACHSCDSPGCVNPAHIFPGSHADNCLDKLLKGRGRGKSLAHEQIEYVLSSSKSGAALARELRVSEATISRARRGKIWPGLSSKKSTIEPHIAFAGGVRRAPALLPPTTGARSFPLVP